MALTDIVGGAGKHLQNQALMISALDKLDQLGQSQLEESREFYLDSQDRFEQLVKGELFTELKTQTQLLTDIRDDISKIAGTTPNRISPFDDAAGKVNSATVDLQAEAAKIAIMAGAIFALGVAFGVVGKLDIASVISVSVGIFIIAETFRRIAEVKGITNPLKVAAVSVAIIAMANAMVLSSVILQFMMPVSPAKLASLALIAVALIPVVFAFSKIFSLFTIGTFDFILRTAAAKAFNVAQPNKGAAKNAINAIPMLVGAVVLSSIIMQFGAIVPPAKIASMALIGLGLIPIATAFSIIFGVASFIEKRGLQKIGIATVALVAMVTGLVAVSYIVGKFNSSGISTAVLGQMLLLGLALVPLAIAFRTLVSADLTIKQMIFAAAAIPLIALAVKGALLALQGISGLGAGITIAFAQSVFFLSMALIPVVILMAIVKRVVKDTKGLIMAAAALPIMAASMVATGLIFLAFPRNTEAPPTGFVIGTAFALLAVALVIRTIGRMRLQTVIRAALIMPVIALGIVGTAFAFKLLPRDPRAPDVDFTLKMGLALLVIVPTLIILGAFGLKFVALGTIAALGVALAIVGISWVFQLLPRDMRAPDVDYSLKIGLALLVFLPSMLIFALLPAATGLKGLIGGVSIAVAILAISWVFQLLPQNLRAPDYEFSLKTGLALLAFVPAAILLGLIPIPIIAKGLINTVIVSLGIVALAWIFQLLPQNFNFPSIAFSISTGISLILLGGIMGVLGLIPTPTLLIGLLNLAIVGAAIALFGFLLSLVPKDVFGEGGFISQIADSIKILGFALAEVLGKLVREVLPPLGKFIAFLLDNIVGILPTILPPLQNFIQVLAGAAQVILESIVPVLDLAVQGIIGVLTIVKDALVAILPVIADAFKSVLSTMLDGARLFGDMFKFLFEQGPEKVAAMGLALISLAAGIVAVSAAMLGATAGNAITSALGGAIEFLTGETVDPIDAVVTLLERLNGLEVAGERLQIIGNALLGVAALGKVDFSEFERFLGLVKDLDSDKFVVFSKNFTNMLEETKDKVELSSLTIGENVNDFIKVLEDGIPEMNEFATAMDKVNNEFERMVDMMKPIDKIAESFGSMAKSMGSFKDSVNEIDAQVLKDTSTLMANTGKLVELRAGGDIERVFDAIAEGFQSITANIQPGQVAAPVTGTTSDDNTSNEQIVQQMQQLNMNLTRMMGVLTNQMQEMNSTLAGTLRVKTDELG